MLYLFLFLKKKRGRPPISRLQSTYIVFFFYININPFTYFFLITQRKSTHTHTVTLKTNRVIFKLQKKKNCEL